VSTSCVLCVCVWMYECVSLSTPFICLSLWICVCRHCMSFVCACVDVCVRECVDSIYMSACVCVDARFIRVT